MPYAMGFIALTNACGAVESSYHREWLMAGVHLFFAIALGACILFEEKP